MKRGHRQKRSFPSKSNLNEICSCPHGGVKCFFWPVTSFMVRWKKDWPFWPQWVEKCKALKCFQTFGGGNVIVCCYLALDGIMKKADYLKILQLLLKSTSSSEKLDIRRQLWIPRGQWLQTHIKTLSFWIVLPKTSTSIQLKTTLESCVHGRNLKDTFNSSFVMFGI